MKKQELDRWLGAAFALGPLLLLASMILVINSGLFYMNFQVHGFLVVYAAGFAGFCMAVSLSLLFSPGPARIIQAALLIGLVIAIPFTTVYFNSPPAKAYLIALAVILGLLVVSGRELARRLILISIFAVLGLTIKLGLMLTGANLHIIRVQSEVAFYSFRLSGELIADLILISALILTAWCILVLSLALAGSPPPAAREERT